MNEMNTVKQTIKMVAFVALAILLCRFSKGYFAPIFVLVGVWCAFSDKIGWALAYFVLMPFFVIMNPGVLPKESAVIGMSMRFGPLLIGFCLALKAGSRKGRHRLPLMGIVPFLGVACISAAGGWVPAISYLKIVNFIFFLFGVWYGTQNLQHRPKDVFILRSFFLALAVILVFGSIMTMAVPSIGYASGLRYALAEGGAEYANEVFRQRQADSMMSLFCGITNHSQALGPILCCALGWVMCDMLLVENRFSKLHVSLIVFCFPLLYMTRSRVALMTALFTVSVIYFYTVRKTQLPSSVRASLGKGMMLLALMVAVAAVGAELKSGAISRWVRKTQDVETDKRSLSEAVTSSRLGLIDQSLWEFQRNPLFGSGFQVSYYTQELAKSSRGLVFSAPIEKGILPVMVLGETGIVGEICFLVFLVSFFGVSARRGYYVTISLTATYLMTNMGEATFFSPGGGGGIMWMISVVGGFTIDTLILFRRNLQRQWAQISGMRQYGACQLENRME